MNICYAIILNKRKHLFYNYYLYVVIQKDVIQVRHCISFLYSMRSKIKLKYSTIIFLKKNVNNYLLKLMN